MVFKERTFHGKAPEEIFPQGYADLETRVADRLSLVDGLDASDITVVSKGNTVVLDGTVSTTDEIKRAYEAAVSVQGVAEVTNRITAV